MPSKSPKPKITPSTTTGPLCDPRSGKGKMTGEKPGDKCKKGGKKC